MLDAVGPNRLQYFAYRAPAYYVSVVYPHFCNISKTLLFNYHSK